MVYRKRPLTRTRRRGIAVGAALIVVSVLDALKFSLPVSLVLALAAGLLVRIGLGALYRPK
jgi:uncharacterized membrane protein YccC